MQFSYRFMNTLIIVCLPDLHSSQLSDGDDDDDNNDDDDGDDDDGVPVVVMMVKRRPLLEYAFYS